MSARPIRAEMVFWDVPKVMERHALRPGSSADVPEVVQHVGSTEHSPWAPVNTKLSSFAHWPPAANRSSSCRFRYLLRACTAA